MVLPPILGLKSLRVLVPKIGARCKIHPMNPLCAQQLMPTSPLTTCSFAYFFVWEENWVSLGSSFACHFVWEKSETSLIPLGQNPPKKWIVVLVSAAFSAYVICWPYMNPYFCGRSVSKKSSKYRIWDAKGPAVGMKVHVLSTKKSTPPKTNMSPENQWLEDVFPIKGPF